MKYLNMMEGYYDWSFFKPVYQGEGPSAAQSNYRMICRNILLDMLYSMLTSTMMDRTEQ